MRSFHSVAIAILLLSTAAAAQVPVVDLATAPADARQFTIMSIAGKHGTASTWTAPDGTLMGRMSLNLRDQFWE
jgi:hypothetical protein